MEPDTLSSPWWNIQLERMRNEIIKRHHRNDHILRLRRKLNVHQSRTHFHLIQQLSRESGIDIEQIYSEARRHNKARRRYVEKALKSIDAQLDYDSVRDRTLHEDFRARYKRDFMDNIRKRWKDGNPEKKFVEVVRLSDTAEPGAAAEIFSGSGDFGPDSSYRALTYTELTGSSEPPYAVPVTCKFLIQGENGGVQDSSPGDTFQDIWLRMPSFAQTFQISAITLDLWATGISRAILGDLECPILAINPEYAHTHLWLSIYIGQFLHSDDSPVGELHWQSVGETHEILNRAGDVAESLVVDLSTEAIGSSLILRGRDVGGGDLIAAVIVHAEAQALGVGGTVLLDFYSGSNQMEVGCLTLQGSNI